jgi:hypothetical protein
MQFEKVHTIRDIYDGIRSGTADLSGAPHYFASLFDDKMDDYAVSAQFMERELRHWAVYRTWEAKFHRGLEPLKTHPGYGGIVPEYDELSECLNEQIKARKKTYLRRRPSWFIVAPMTFCLLSEGHLHANPIFFRTLSNPVSWNVAS